MLRFLNGLFAMFCIGMAMLYVLLRLDGSMPYDLRMEALFFTLLALGMAALFNVLRPWSDEEREEMRRSRQMADEERREEKRRQQERRIEELLSRARYRERNTTNQPPR